MTQPVVTQLLTNAVSVTQRIFGSDRLLSTVQLALFRWSCFIIGLYKAAFAFGFAFERI